MHLALFPTKWQMDGNQIACNLVAIRLPCSCHPFARVLENKKGSIGLKRARSDSGARSDSFCFPALWQLDGKRMATGWHPSGMCTFGNSIFFWKFQSMRCATFLEVCKNEAFHTRHSHQLLDGVTLRTRLVDHRVLLQIRVSRRGGARNSARLVLEFVLVVLGSVLCHLHDAGILLRP